MEIRKTPNDTAALSFVANSEAARYVFVLVAAADFMIAGRRYGTFVLACRLSRSATTVRQQQWYVAKKTPIMMGAFLDVS